MSKNQSVKEESGCEPLTWCKDAKVWIDQRKISWYPTGIYEWSDNFASCVHYQDIGNKICHEGVLRPANFPWNSLCRSLLKLVEDQKQAKPDTKFGLNHYVYHAVFSAQSGETLKAQICWNIFQWLGFGHRSHSSHLLALAVWRRTGLEVSVVLFVMALCTEVMEDALAQTHDKPCQSDLTFKHLTAFDNIHKAFGKSSQNFQHCANWRLQAQHGTNCTKLQGSWR